VQYYLLHFLTQGVILISEREVREMETYTREELKMWFEIMKKEYHGSPMETDLEMVEMKMFAEDFDFRRANDIRNILKENSKKA
jgi:hypothetical protein